MKIFLNTRAFILDDKTSKTNKKRHMKKESEYYTN